MRSSVFPELITAPVVCDLGRYHDRRRSQRIHLFKATSITFLPGKPFSVT